ncbi:hypothetical protein [Nonomuraea sp. NPDC049480]|uniref:hypothetical protein n=1 Tax=Nonomuraea sp. NPDC049480 TaxID=3364353 RepID=UPI0037A41DEA
MTRDDMCLYRPLRDSLSNVFSDLEPISRFLKITHGVRRRLLRLSAPSPLSRTLNISGPVIVDVGKRDAAQTEQYVRERLQGLLGHVG